MPDIFISYSTQDSEIAEFCDRTLRSENLTVFRAEVSLEPGFRWTPVIMQQMRESPWVIFLCSANSCRSHYVQQEIGAALFSDKTIVPVVWNMDPGQLPGWTNQHPCLDLRGATYQDLHDALLRIATRIKAKNATALLIGGAIFAALLFFGNGKK